jgi:hypothetical protein
MSVKKPYDPSEALASKLCTALTATPDHMRFILFEHKLSKDDFISARVSLYFRELENAVREGNDLTNAEKIANSKCFFGLVVKD